MEMVELVCAERPPSWNNSSGKKQAAFRNALQAAFRHADPPTGFHGPLYGLVVVFARAYRPSVDPDADNLSKKVWDDLKQLGAYRDDQQVTLRTAIILDLRLDDMTVLDVSSMPDMARQAIDALREQPETSRAWLTFIRYGRLDTAILSSAMSMGRA